jgi:hypothetical protein
VTRRPGLVWLCVFIALVALECYPVWTLGHFPSQDGPSHLYNAAVLAQWSGQPVYRQYYELHFTPAGNLLFQFALAGMIQVLSPVAIEKLLLTAYIVLFALAFLWLIEIVNPRARWFALFGLIFIPNGFFQVGFWNFIFSIPLALLALRYFLRGRAGATPLWLGLLTVWGLAVYEMHMASWMVLALAIGLFCAYDLLELLVKERKLPARTVLGSAIRVAMPLVTLAPPLVLTLWFMLGSGYRGVGEERLPETFADRFKPLAALSFLRTPSDVDLLFTAAFAMLVGAMAAAAVWSRLRAPRVFRPGDMWAVLACACGLLSILAPSAASGVFIRHRLALYAWIFAVVWLAAQSWKPRAVRACAATACLLAALPFFWRMPEYRHWDRLIAEFTSVGPGIVPGSTVLALATEEQPHRIKPLLHAVDWFAPKPFIDLRNYEAATAYFPTQFRPGLMPFDSLGTIDELQATPPVFHPARYEQRSHEPVDYLLFYGSPGGTEPERERYAAELRDYRLVAVSQPTGLVRLYRRTR